MYNLTTNMRLWLHVIVVYGQVAVLIGPITCDFDTHRKLITKICYDLEMGVGVRGLQRDVLKHQYLRRL